MKLDPIVQKMNFKHFFYFYLFIDRIIIRYSVQLTSNLDSGIEMLYKNLIKISIGNYFDLIVSAVSIRIDILSTLSKTNWWL